MSNKDDIESSKADMVQEGLGASALSGESPSNWYAIVLQQVSVYGVAVGYCVSASLLSIINKWAVMKFPYPGALTALQYFTSAAGVFVCGCAGFIEHDRLDLLTMWRFLPAAIIFYLSLFTNSELLLHANVDTFIVFRSVVPIFVAIGETLFLHQPWPSMKTWFSLATILAGLNTWGLVLYNNLEALLLFPLELLIMGELKKIKQEISDESDWHSFAVVLPVGLSCLFGLSISFFGFSCRRAISATGFTVLGIVNKLLTVVINLVIWDKHSTFIGTVGLLICMFGGILYQQSTSSKPKAATKEVRVDETVDEEQQKLLEMQSVSDSDNAENKVSQSEDGKS
ncbi:GDP-mannose transporter GONST3 isoform X2 [Benincasa hispida]|uniref:GDP-mannose transporter GONST3 isoform X2 n=1 Tax=Benincasa hispida TaxID=102211 RepID=UPI0018FF2719|nr:GDP-mannose transporter GONST3 isoform X2 [Benincasa hispida]